MSKEEIKKFLELDINTEDFYRIAFNTDIIMLQGKYNTILANELERKFDCKLHYNKFTSYVEGSWDNIKVTLTD